MTNKDEEIGSRAVPQSWAWASLGELSCDASYGTSEKCDYSGEGPPVLRIPNVAAGLLDLSDLKYAIGKSRLNASGALREGDLLIVRTNGSKSLIGRGAVVKHGLPRNHFFASYLIRFRLYNDGSLPAYIGAIWHSPYVREWIEHNAATSAGQYNISLSSLSHLRLPVPPLLEQTRIVAEIERLFSLLDAGVANLKRVQANLKRYRASVLQAACTGKLVPTEAELARAEGRDYEPANAFLQRILTERRARWEADQLAKMQAAGREPKDDKWKAKYEEPAAPDTNGLPRLPQGWVSVSLAQISSRITDGTHQPPIFVSEGVPFIFVQHIVNGTIRFTNTRFISSDTHKQLNSRCPVEIGDILYSAVGSYGVAVPVKVSRPFSFQRHIAHIKPVCQGLQEYVVHVLNSSIGLDQAHKVAKGVAQKTVTLGDLTKFIVSLPPFAEQERIVAEVERRLSVVDALETTVKQNLKRAERLRQAILRDAFAGKLVPQDPSDEPASVLLSRIEAERASTTVTGKSTRPPKVRTRDKVPITANNASTTA